MPRKIRQFQDWLVATKTSVVISLFMTLYFYTYAYLTYFRYIYISIVYSLYEPISNSRSSFGNISVAFECQPLLPSERLCGARTDRLFWPFEFSYEKGVRWRARGPTAFSYERPHFRMSEPLNQPVAAAASCWGSTKQLCLLLLKPMHQAKKRHEIYENG